MIRTSKLLARFLPAVLMAVTLVPAEAQRPFSGAAEIEQRLHKLNELGTVLMIAAHPDDERTAVLAYFARGRYMRTAYLSLTRGEGGQNLIGSEQGAQLGIIRTQELLAARRIDGAEQFFTRAIDFGFTKTAAETLEKWGHERILSDVVWVIRRYRPDVIVLVFSGTPRDGHGQHQVSAILGKEAFTAAADPARFPEQLQYVKPWRTRRIVQAAGNFFGPPPVGRGGQGQLPTNGGGAGRGGRTPEPPGQMPTVPTLPPSGEADTGVFNPILGYSYEELAVLSRSMHHSQGTGAMRRPGGNMTPFLLVGGDAAKTDLFDGIDTSWNRLPGGAAVGQIFAEAVRNYDPVHPEKLVPLLLKARPVISAIDDPLAKTKLAELDEAIASCAGLWIEAQPKSAEVTPGEKLSVTTTVMNRSNVPIAFEGASFEGMWHEDAQAKTARLGYNQGIAFEFTRETPANQPYSQPYWLVKPPSGDVYTVADQRLIGLADTPPALTIRLKFSVDGAPFEVVRPVEFRYAERSEGERMRPLVVVPTVSVNLPEPVTVFPAAKARKVHVAVRANVANAAGEVKLQAPAGWKVEPAAQPYSVTTAGEQQELTFDVTPPAADSTAPMRAVAIAGGREIAAGMQVISYPHFPAQTLFPPSDIKAVRTNIAVTAHRIGYIMGAGDEMPDALRQLGLDLTLLSKTDLDQGDLSRFDAIVAGVRAYNVRDDLRANQSRLLDYVKNGGTYVVQYQTGENVLSLGPYPITVPPGTRYRVTVEEAPVKFPHVDSPLLQYPNHINPKDFEGWIQERGLYFATQWDPKYQSVLSSHDPGEEGMEGGELWTRYGKGVYIFTAYAWFRQLPGGVPGAFRLFANLLSAK